MSEVTLTNLHKVYPNGFCALQELSLSVGDGEFLVLVGPSGCGNSTALQMIAGLESITGGEIRIGERIVNDQPPKARDIAMVFQDYALYPHMTVAKNIAFPLELAKIKKSEIKQRVAETADVLGLAPQLDKRPGELSGGQKQRVAMGRAIVRQPAVFLMDEPLSNLDAKLRVQMRGEIARIQAELGTTTIYVTHDQVEAMTMGDRVAVMLDGELQQVATPKDLYSRPANVFVAGFIGSPPMNLLRGRVSAATDGVAVRVGSAEFVLDARSTARHPRLREFDGRDVAVGIRPECLTPTDQPDGALAGPARLVESLGAEVLVHVVTDAEPIDINDNVDDADARAELGAELHVAGGAVVVARFDAETTVRKGDTVSLAVDRSKLHFFDVDGGTRLTAPS
ncbi:trehalose ABC transporter ATP-binding protein SugC [soil metagenome]